MSNTLSYDDVVRNLDDLPSLPAVVMELLNSIDQDDVDISVLAKKVSYDPVSYTHLTLPTKA